jgi:hypothetical protein
MILRKQLCSIGIVTLIVVAGLAALVYYAGADSRDRRTRLQLLLASNAPLQEIESKIGSFTITRKSSLQWDQLIEHYRSGSDWDKHIYRKMDQASAVGHNSTMWIQTWVFLDKDDRLIDFELGTQ